MKKKNGKVLDGTIGTENINCADFNRSLNAWAKRRGIVWESAFTAEKRRWAAKKASHK